MAGDRSLTYKVLIDTSSARAQAAQVRSSIEAELKTINAGQVQVAAPKLSPLSAGGGSSGIGDQTAEMSRFEQAVSGGAKRIVGDLKSIALGYLSIQAAIGAVTGAVALAQLQTESARASKSFEILSGSAEKAQINISAIQRASNGTVDSLTAIKIGNQALSLGLASSSDEFERLVRTARLIVQVSPVINDIGDALTQLSLFSSNAQSYQRADQLGLAAEEVRERIKDLQAENGNLTDSQAKLEASIQIVNEKFGATADTIEAQASGVEKLTVAWTEFKIALSGGAGPVQNFTESLADGINQITVLMAGTAAPINILIGNLKHLEEQTRTIEDADFFSKGISFFTGGDVNAGSQKIKIVSDALTSALDAVSEGIPGSGNILSQIQGIAVSVDKWNGATDAQIEKVRELSTELNNLIANGGRAQAQALTAEEQAAAAAAARSKSILDQSEPLSTSLTSEATKVVDTAGLEATLATLAEAKALVDQGITDLINSTVTDPDEIALRIQQIQDQAGQLFTDLEERANNFSFSGIDQAFAGIFENLNFPEIDFLPGLESLRDEVASLYEEISASGSVTEEQALLLDYYSSAASAAADSTSGVTQVVDELGGAFIEQNQLVGELISQLYLTEAAYASGQISAAQFAGQTAALGGQLLAYIQQAGGATSATYALIAAQSGMQGTPGFITGFGRGNATGAYLKSQEDARAREQARKDAERARKEAESAAKKAAREAESAAKRAGKALEDGAKKARQELESALKNVPGLFSRSQVTQGQLDQAKSGVPQNFADDYIRRLEDEVFNGNDWQDVSIDEARSSLQALGVQVSNDNKVAFQQFVEAWESGLLFFDADNIAKFINAEAVQASIDLQEKARIGQENIMKAFGVAIDDAAEAAVSGISAASGGASGSFTDGEYTVPVTAELIPIPDSEFEPGGAFAPIVKPVIQPQMQGPLPKSAFMPTLGGVSPVIDVAAIQGELNTLTIAPTIDISGINFDEVIGTLEDSLNVTANITEVWITDDAQASLVSIVDGLTPTITATVDTITATEDTVANANAIKESLTPAITATVSSTVVTADAFQQYETIKANLTPHITAVIDSVGFTVASLAEVKASGVTVADILKSSIASSIATTQWNDDGIVAPIATGLVTAINTQVRGTQDGFKREGQGIASLVMYGMSQGWREVNADGSAINSLATGLLSELNNQLSANQNFFFAAGQTPASNLIDGYKNFFGGGSDQAAELITPLLSALGTGIRANIEGFRQRGGTVAREMIGGFSAQFNSEEFKTTLIAAGETMASYLTIGILSGINGGQLVEAIGAQVLADITATVEEPAP